MILFKNVLTKFFSESLIPSKFLLKKLFTVANKFNFGAYILTVPDPVDIDLDILETS